MNLSEAINGVCDEARINRSIGTTYDRVVREINRVSRDIWNGYPWTFRWKNYQFVTDVDVTTGTVTATNGSRTLTGSSTAFLSTHVGWHIYFPGDSVQHWYKILNYTSATSVQLNVPYQGTSGSGKSYVLRHFDYTLPTEVWDLGSVSATVDRRPLDIVEPIGYELMSPSNLYSGYPTAVSLFGSNNAYTRYNTGNVSGTQVTKTITGSGTAFLANVQPGDEIWINDFGNAVHYTIDTVDSDTQLTLYNFLADTISGSAYVITRLHSRYMRLMWPSSTSYVIDVRAARLYNDLVLTSETNEFLIRYPDMIVKNVACTELGSLGDIRKAQLRQEASQMLLSAKAEDEAITKKTNVRPIFTYRNG